MAGTSMVTIDTTSGTRGSRAAREQGLTFKVSPCSVL